MKKVLATLGFEMKLSQRNLLHKAVLNALGDVHHTPFIRHSPWVKYCSNLGIISICFSLNFCGQHKVMNSSQAPLSSSSSYFSYPWDLGSVVKVDLIAFIILALFIWDEGMSNFPFHVKHERVLINSQLLGLEVKGVNSTCSTWVIS